MDRIIRALQHASGAGAGDPITYAVGNVLFITWGVIIVLLMK